MEINILFRIEEYEQLLAKKRSCSFIEYLHYLLKLGIEKDNKDFAYAYRLDFPKYKNIMLILNSEELNEVIKLSHNPENTYLKRISELVKYLILELVKDN